MSLWKDLLGHKSTSSNRDSAKKSPIVAGISTASPQSSFSLIGMFVDKYFSQHLKAHLSASYNGQRSFNRSV